MTMLRQKISFPFSKLSVSTELNFAPVRRLASSYAKKREECETKLAVLIVEMKSEIKAEKERRKQTASA